MEITFDTLLNIASLLVGGGGGAFFTWRYVRQKAKAEAKEAESTAAKEEQDVYQQIIADLKADREYMKAYNLEVKKDRDEIRQERDELRKRLDNLEETIRRLKDDVAQNKRQLECIRPFLCGRAGCMERIDVDFDRELQERKQKKQ